MKNSRKKAISKKVLSMLVLFTVILLIAACGNKMSAEEIERMKIEQTIGRYLDGYAMNDSAQIMQVVDVQEANKADIQAVLDQVLEIVHREPYQLRIAYQIDNMAIQDDFALVKLSAVLRIYQNDSELFSVRLFKDKDLSLVKDEYDEWKIDFSQFIPEELLKIDLLF